jgi:hypothetical protein
MISIFSTFPFNILRSSVVDGGARIRKDPHYFAVAEPERDADPAPLGFRNMFNIPFVVDN